jgi:hypothetical protein
MRTDPIEEMRPKHGMTTEERIEAVKAWAQYVREHPVEVWGPEHTRFINSHVEAARDADLDIEQWVRIEEWKQCHRPAQRPRSPEDG